MAEIYLHGIPVPFPTESENQRPDTDGEPPRYIILHSTGGAFAGAVSWLLQQKSGVSAHFVASRAGALRQLVSVHHIAYHAGVSHWGRRSNMNTCALGIEMEHLDGRQDWPEAQVAAVAHLCAALMVNFRIPIENILGHNQIAPGRKVDPAGFPWPRFRDKIRAILTKKK